MVDMMFLTSSLTFSEYNESFRKLQTYLTKHSARHQLRKSKNSERYYVTNGFSNYGFQEIRLLKGSHNICRIEIKFRPQLTFNRAGYYTLTKLNEFAAVEESFNYVVRDVLDLPVPKLMEWKVKRLEAAVDIRIKPSLIPIFIALFKKGFIPEYFLANETTQKYFSSKLNVYLTSKKVAINWYNRYKTTKHKDKKSYKRYADYSGIRGIFRIETQWRDYNKTVAEALDLQEIKSRILKFYKIIVGTGDYYTLDAAVQKIERSVQRSFKRYELIELLKLIHEHGSIYEAKRHFILRKDKETAADKFSKRIKQFEKLNINPVVLDDDLGIPSLKNLYSKIEAEIDSWD